MKELNARRFRDWLLQRSPYGSVGEARRPYGCPLATYLGPAMPRPVLTHCPAGHPYDESNTYISKKGVKVCRTCRAASQRRYLASRK